MGPKSYPPELDMSIQIWPWNIPKLVKVFLWQQFVVGNLLKWNYWNICHRFDQLCLREGECWCYIVIVYIFVQLKRLSDVWLQIGCLVSRWWGQEEKIPSTFIRLNKKGLQWLARQCISEHVTNSCLGHIYIKTCKVFRADWILPLDLSLQC